MNAFESDLKRMFAEVPDPADDSFSVRVAEKVQTREASRKWAGWARIAAFVVGALTALVAVFMALKSFGLMLMADMGLGLARLHGLVTEAEFSSSLNQSIMGVGLTQILLMTLALAGGAYAMRRARD